MHGEFCLYNRFQPLSPHEQYVPNNIFRKSRRNQNNSSRTTRYWKTGDGTASPYRTPRRTRKTCPNVITRNFVDKSLALYVARRLRRPLGRDRLVWEFPKTSFYRNTEVGYGRYASSACNGARQNVVLLGRPTSIKRE